MPAEKLPSVLRLLFQSHAYYIDRESRKAVRKCLQSLYDAETYSAGYLKRMVAAIKMESQKPGIAASSAFVLLEWTNDLLPQLAADLDNKASEFTDIITATVSLLNLCLGHPQTKNSVKVTAVRGTRRSLRAAFAGDNREKVIEKIVKQLTTKSSAPAPVNSLLLTIVCGVSSRKEKAKPVVEGLKKDIYGFYVREIIQSKVAVAPYLLPGWDDFFSAFTTAEEFDAEILPAVERGLLRSPEVLLQGVISRLFESLPEDIDLSKSLQDKLLKQFLSCIKSTNPVIRNGTVSAFKSAIVRCKDVAAIEKIAVELANPLKAGKVPSAEHRTLQSMMLESIPPSPALSKLIPAALSPVVAKEPNEPALNAEITTLMKHLTAGLSEGDVAIEKTVIEAVKKGLSDKRPTVRKFWFIQIGEVLWANKQTPSSAYLSFVAEISQSLLDGFTEVYDNTLPAIQNGLVIVAYVTTAIIQDRILSWGDEKLTAAFSKAQVGKKALSETPKVPFLISSKAYTKLVSQEDQLWAVRALASTAGLVVYDQGHADHWALAYLYFISAPSINPAARQEAVKSLTAVYLRHPESISKIIVSGIWQWVRRTEIEARNEKESDIPAYAIRVGGNRIKDAINAITFSDKADAGGFKDSVLLDEEVVKNQLISMAVATHHQLIPGNNWIALCQKAGVDPGSLAKEMSGRLIGEIRLYSGLSGESVFIRDAALNTAATLAFVAPENITPLLVNLFKKDLDPALLKDIGPTEIGMWRTPAGTTFVDVLAKAGAPQVDKKGKDAKTLQWESELRAQLAQKKGAERKLTPDEKAKVEAQLKKEEEVRKRVSEIELKLKRGVGLIQSLASGAPTAVELWMYQGVNALLKCLEAGGGMIIGSGGVKAYLVRISGVSDGYRG